MPFLHNTRPFLHNTLPFWCHFGDILVPKIGKKLDRILQSILDASFAVKGRFWVPFRSRFGDFFGPKINQKSHRIPKAILEAILAPPGQPPRPKTLILLKKYAKNRRSTFGRRGASEVDFGSQNGAKMETQIDQKSIRNRGLNLEGKKVARIASEVDLGCQNGTKVALESD